MALTGWSHRLSVASKEREARGRREQGRGRRGGMGASPSGHGMAQRHTRRPVTQPQPGDVMTSVGSVDLVGEESEWSRPSQRAL